MTQTTTSSTTAAPEAVDRPHKVGLAPLAAAILAVWFMIAPSFVRYPFTVEGENASLRERGLSLLLLLTAVCWARARTHARRFLVVYAVLGAVLVVEAVTLGGGLGGRLGAASWNELVGGVLVLVVAAAGWRSSATRSARA
jgi:hypothetical protein